MSKFDFLPTEKRTFYFIGVTTGKSSIMKVFPEWAKYLGIGDCQIKGIDCKQHDDPEMYRKVVGFIKSDKLSLGGLVTTHKIDLLKACRDMFDQLGPYAKLLDEVSCISKRDGKLRGHAKDPITSGLALEAFVPKEHWEKTRGELCILGAGGSSLALTTYFMKSKPKNEWPSKIYVTNRSTPRLETMKNIHKQINPGIEIEYFHCPKPEDNDKVVNSLKAGSMVVNATGLGKDEPGSPVTDSVKFPENGFAWEFNYRGNLVFLKQANAQKKARNLTINDGWIYFIHGWTRVIAEVFNIFIPTEGHKFDQLSKIAASVRK
jgi:shikimate 5-dehydrogenase